MILERKLETWSLKISTVIHSLEKIPNKAIIMASESLVFKDTASGYRLPKFITVRMNQLLAVFLAKGLNISLPIRQIVQTLLEEE